jgi:hypothetical protein
MNELPVGTSVRVKAKTWLKDRTGEVVALGLFPWRDYRSIQFDPRPDGSGLMKPILIEVAELKAIPSSERPESAPARRQLSLLDPP